MHGRTARWRRFVCGRRRSFFAGGRSFFRGTRRRSFFPRCGNAIPRFFRPCSGTALRPLTGLPCGRGCATPLRRSLPNRSLPAGKISSLPGGIRRAERKRARRSPISATGFRMKRTTVFMPISPPSRLPRERRGDRLAVYTDSFSHAAELLSEGRCTAVLFPCETEDGHFLPSVEGLIREYDLKKTVVCPLSPKLGGASYALLRKSLCFTPACSHGEFRLPRNNKTARALYELPLLAAADGLTVERGGNPAFRGREGRGASLSFPRGRGDGRRGRSRKSGGSERGREEKSSFANVFLPFDGISRLYGRGILPVPFSSGERRRRKMKKDSE